MKNLSVVTLLCFTVCLSSCCIIRSLKRDGLAGPNCFSYQHGELDTLNKSDKPFEFARSTENSILIDTLRYFRQNGTGLKSPVTLARAMNNKSEMQGVMVIKNDTIIYEKYWGGFAADTKALIFSVSKSVTSLLCGIAIDEGYIGSIDDPVTKYIPELKKKDERWQRLTINHLLNMKSGLDADDTYSFNLKNLHTLNQMSKLEYSHNLLKVVCSQRFKCEPGTTHEYNSMTTAVLGIVLERATKRPLADYLNEKVWQPLGMQHDGMIMVDSKENRHGYGFGGIVTTMLDLAKIGRLYLNNGEWNGQQIVSKNWITESARADEENDGYHHSWYNITCVGVKEMKHPGYYALGIRGQVLYVNPDKNVIMVRIGREDNTYVYVPWAFEALCNEAL